VVPEPAERDIQVWSLTSVNESAPSRACDARAAWLETRCAGLPGETQAHRNCERRQFRAHSQVGGCALVSAWLFAVIETEVCVFTFGAANKPDELIIPVVADQVTAAFELLVTVAVSCCVPPVLHLRIRSHRRVPDRVRHGAGDTDIVSADPRHPSCGGRKQYIDSIVCAPPCARRPRDLPAGCIRTHCRSSACEGHQHFSELRRHQGRRRNRRWAPNIRN
jgi:hypothetical protein